MYVPHSGHSRHYKEDMQGEYRNYRYGKHRYIYFCTHNKRLREKWKSELRYPILPYPKGDNNPDYELGDFMSATLLNVNTGQLVKAKDVEGILPNDNFKMEGF